MLAEVPLIGQDVVIDPAAGPGARSRAIGLVEVEVGRGVSDTIPVTCDVGREVALVIEAPVVGVDSVEGCVYPEIKAVNPRNVDADIAAEVEVGPSAVPLGAGRPERADLGSVLAVDEFSLASVRKIRLAVRGETAGVKADRDVVAVGVGKIHVDADLKP